MAQKSDGTIGLFSEDVGSWLRIRNRLEFIKGISCCIQEK